MIDIYCKQKTYEKFVCLSSEPPDKTARPTHTALPVTTVFISHEVTTDLEGTTVPVSLATTSVNKVSANNTKPNIDIYKTVYYLAIFVYKFVTS